MAATVLLSELITQVRQRADMVNSQFCTDAEITSYLNGSLAELYDIITTEYEDYYFIGPIEVTINPLGTVTQSGGTDVVLNNAFVLPTDFLKMRGVDRLVNGSGITGTWQELRRFNFANRNKTNSEQRRSVSGIDNMSYRVSGNIVNVLPVVSSPGTYRYWYIPSYQNLVNPTDTCSALQNWQEYAIVDAVIKCLQKEETDVATFQVQKEQLKERIVSASANRNAGDPEVLVEVNDNGGWWG